MLLWMTIGWLVLKFSSLIHKFISFKCRIVNIWLLSPNTVESFSGNLQVHDIFEAYEVVSGSILFKLFALLEFNQVSLSLEISFFNFIDTLWELYKLLWAIKIVISANSESWWHQLKTCSNYRIFWTVWDVKSELHSM